MNVTACGFAVLQLTATAPAFEFLAAGNVADYVVAAVLVHSDALDIAPLVAAQGVSWTLVLVAALVGDSVVAAAGTVVVHGCSWLCC